MLAQYCTKYVGLFSLTSRPYSFWTYITRVRHSIHWHSKTYVFVTILPSYELSFLEITNVFISLTLFCFMKGITCVRKDIIHIQYIIINIPRHITRIKDINCPKGHNSCPKNIPCVFLCPGGHYLCLGKQWCSYCTLPKSHLSVGRHQHLFLWITKGKAVQQERRPVG